ncbi:MAG: DUF4389 domain-containing protein [Chloroflexota bacterium]|nr:DUF4389 domain-containing protein [Chloroflexota bacterium]
MTAETAGYPVEFEVDDAMEQNRLSILFRWLLVIPHAIILSFLGVAAGIVVVLAWFTILFAGRFPEALLRFTTGYSRWAARANAYGSLLTGAYPPFSMEEEPDYPVRLVIRQQTVGRNRLTTFFRWILSIPHIIVLNLLGIVAGFVMLAAWLAGVVLGRVPAGLHSFLVGFTAWTERVSAYSYLLVDDYPPFSLE